jgi:hypothetical protein
MAALALVCLVMGSVVSYARARAEGLGMTASVGIAERADRLVAVLVTTGLVGLGLPEVFLTVVLALLAVASLVTVVQRMLTVRRQALSAAVAPPATGTSSRPSPDRGGPQSARPQPAERLVGSVPSAATAAPADRVTDLPVDRPQGADA